LILAAARQKQALQGFTGHKPAPHLVLHAAVILIHLLQEMVAFLEVLQGPLVVCLQGKNPVGQIV
jgi:hypothetical protein